MKRKKKSDPDLLLPIEEPNNKCNWFNNKVKKLSSQLWLPQNECLNNCCNKNNIPFEIIYPFSINDSNIKFKQPEIINKIEIATKLKESYNKSVIKINNGVSKNKDTALKSLKTKYDKKCNNIGKIIKSKMFLINFNKNQHTIIQKWMFECAKVYNKCVELYNANSKDFSLNYMESKLIVFKLLYGDTDKGCPYAILTDEVRAFCSNVKSCFSNLHNGNIETFTMGYKNIKQNQCIMIPHDSISKNGIYTTLLGNIDIFNDIDFNVPCDTRLNYDILNNKYYLYTPQYHEPINIIHREPVVALDPGEKIFQAFYGVNECGKIGDNMRIRILSYQRKIKKCQSALSKNKNKKGEIIKNKKKLNKNIRTYYRKIKNIVKELHNQTCNFLCKKYDTILIQQFKTQSMMGKKLIKKTAKEILLKKSKSDLRKFSNKCRLSRRVKFVLNMLSHYKFRQHLLQKGKEYGCNVIVVTEEYTSQCCGECGKLSKNYINRIKTCSYCKMTIDRDINGARNILLKNYKTII